MRSSRTTRSSRSPLTRLIRRHSRPSGPGASRGARARLSRGDRLRPERSSGHRRRSRRRRARSSIRMRTRGRCRCITFPTSADSSSASCPSWLAGRPSRAVPLPLELGICVDDERWLIHIDGKHSRVEPEKLSRRHLTLTQSALVRLLMGHTEHRGRVRRGRFHRIDEHGARRRSHPLPAGADLAQPAR